MGRTSSNASTTSPTDVCASLTNLVMAHRTITPNPKTNKGTIQGPSFSVKDPTLWSQSPRSLSLGLPAKRRTLATVTLICVTSTSGRCCSRMCDCALRQIASTSSDKDPLYSTSTVRPTDARFSIRSSTLDDTTRTPRTSSAPILASSDSASSETLPSRPFRWVVVVSKAVSGASFTPSRSSFIIATSSFSRHLPPVGSPYPTPPSTAFRCVICVLLPDKGGT